MDSSQALSKPFDFSSRNAVDVRFLNHINQYVFDRDFSVTKNGIYPPLLSLGKNRYIVPSKRRTRNPERYLYDYLSFRIFVR